MRRRATHAKQRRADDLLLLPPQIRRTDATCAPGASPSQCSLTAPGLPAWTSVQPADVMAGRAEHPLSWHALTDGRDMWLLHNTKMLVVRLAARLGAREMRSAGFPPHVGLPGLLCGTPAGPQPLARLPRALFPPDARGAAGLGQHVVCARAAPGGPLPCAPGRAAPVKRARRRGRRRRAPRSRRGGSKPGQLVVAQPGSQARFHGGLMRGEAWRARSFSACKKVRIRLAAPTHVA